MTTSQSSSPEIGTKFKIPKGQGRYTGRWAEVFTLEGGTLGIELRNGEKLRAPTYVIERWLAETGGVAVTVDPSELTTVYRIEHIGDGAGCYSRGDEDIDKGMQTILGTTISDERHPVMQNDSKLWAAIRAKGYSAFDIAFGEVLRQYVFGFSSVEQLRSWMYTDSWLTGLADQNYVLAICQVRKRDVLEGNTQCMFVRPKEYEKHDIREYFKI